MSIKNILRPQVKLMRVFGFQFAGSDPVGWQIFSWSYTMSLAIITIPEIYYLIEKRSNISLATNAMCPILYCYMSLPKMVSLHFYRKRLYRLLNELNDLWHNGTRRKLQETVGLIWVFLDSSNGFRKRNSSEISGSGHSHVLSALYQQHYDRPYVSDISVGLR